MADVREPTPSPLSQQFAELTGVFEDLADLCVDGQSQTMQSTEHYALALKVRDKLNAAAIQAQALFACLDPDKPFKDPKA